MARKKTFGNNLDIDLDAIMREETGQSQGHERTGESFPQVRAVSPSEVRSEYSYKRCAFICSPELWGKMQAIAQKEGFTIRQVMEHWMQTGISSYEQKHGTIEPKGKKNIDNVL